MTVLADRYQGRRLNIPNDLVVDPAGRIWFTDPFYEGAAGQWSFDRAHKDLDHDSVYRLDPRPEAIASRELRLIPRGPTAWLFSPGCRTLYVAQSGREPAEARQLRAYPVKDGPEPGSVRGAARFRRAPRHRRHAPGSEGNIIAAAGWELGGPGPMIYVFSPSGEVIETHPVPCRRPTNCAFGGEDLSTLYVTTIEGFLYRARTARRGISR